MALHDVKLPDEPDSDEMPAPRRSRYTFSKTLVRKLDLEALRKPQGPDSGINAIIGKWPGDESDEEILPLLEKLS